MTCDNTLDATGDFSAPEDIDWDDSNSDSDFDENEVDAGLVEHMDVLAVADEGRVETEDDHNM